MEAFQDLPTSASLEKAIIGHAMKVHRVLGAGFLELVYANALAIELRKQGVRFEREHQIAVTYEGEVVGNYVADFIVENRFIVELKAVEALTVNHSLQLVNYLAATRFDRGLLLNFGTKSLQFKTKTRLYANSLHSSSMIEEDSVPYSEIHNSVNSVNSV
jgi:GxxExxY protein